MSDNTTDTAQAYDNQTELPSGLSPTLKAGIEQLREDSTDD